MSGISEQRAVDPQTVALYLRVLGGDLGAAHVWFDAHVLDRYREQAGWRVMRTNTVGRCARPKAGRSTSASPRPIARAHQRHRAQPALAGHRASALGPARVSRRRPAATF